MKLPWMKVWFTFILIIGTFNAHSQQSNSISISITSDSVINTRTKEFITSTFKITNNTKTKINLLPVPSLPDGWRVINKQSEFSIDPGKSIIKIMNFLVPEATPSDSFKIRYAVKDINNPLISGKAEILIKVLPVYQIETRILEKPSYIMIGEKYSCTFEVTNKSNADIDIQLKMISRFNPIYSDTMNINLKREESKIIKYDYKTDPKLGFQIKNPIELSAEILNLKDTVIKTDLVTRVLIVADASKYENLYHFFPISLTPRLVSENRQDGLRQYGYQIDILGSGTLYDYSKSKIDFLLRFPNVQEKAPFFYMRDEYRLNFISDYLQLHFGDRSYFLSKLTEYGQYGFGAEGNVKYGYFDVGTFYVNNRWSPIRGNEFSSYLGFRILKSDSINDLFKLRFNYLNKNEIYNDKIYSIYGALSIDPVLSFEGEYANSSNEIKKGKAYLARMYGNSDWLSYDLNYTHADPTYSGYFKDLDGKYGSISIRPFNALRLSGNYNEVQMNLNRNLQQNSAPHNRYYQAGIDYTFGSSGNIGISYRDFLWENLFENNFYMSNQKSIYSSLNIGFQSIRLSSTVEVGKILNNFLVSENKFQNYNLSFSINLIKSINFGFNANYSNRDYINRDLNEKLLGAGANLLIRFNNDSRMTFNYRTSRWINTYRSFENTSISRYSYLDARYEQRLFSSHQLVLISRNAFYNSQYLKDRISFLVEYKIPLMIPISRKSGIGSIRGKIYDAENPDIEIPNVELYLKDIENSFARTDGDGEYVFTSLKPGKYYLDINRLSSGLAKTTVQKMPIEVIIEGGDEQTINIGIIRSGSIKGKVVIYEFLQKSPFDTSYTLIPKKGLPNCNLSLKNGRPEYALFRSDNNGGFKIQDLIPGKWKLRVIDGVLPPDHYYETDSVNIDLLPGEIKDILIRVIPKKRPIKIIAKADSTPLVIPAIVKKDTIIIVKRDTVYEKPVVTIPPITRRDTITPKPRIEVQPGTKRFSNITETSRLPKSVTEYLDALAEFLKNNRNYFAEITGHTDNKGAYQDKQSRSERKAQRITDYLTGKGVSRLNLTTRGLGDRNPAVPHDSPQGSRINNRVEITLKRR